MRVVVFDLRLGQVSPHPNKSPALASGLGSRTTRYPESRSETGVGKGGGDGVGVSVKGSSPALSRLSKTRDVKPLRPEAEDSLVEWYEVHDLDTLWGQCLRPDDRDSTLTEAPSTPHSPAN